MIRLFSVRLYCSACGRPHEFKIDQALAVGVDEETTAQTASRPDGKIEPQARRHPQGRV